MIEQTTEDKRMPWVTDADAARAEAAEKARLDAVRADIEATRQREEDARRANMKAKLDQESAEARAKREHAERMAAASKRVAEKDAARVADRAAAHAEARTDLEAHAAKKAEAEAAHAAAKAARDAAEATYGSDPTPAVWEHVDSARREVDRTSLVTNAVARNHAAAAASVEAHERAMASVLYEDAVRAISINGLRELVAPIGDRLAAIYLRVRAELDPLAAELDAVLAEHSVRCEQYAERARARGQSPTGEGPFLRGAARDYARLQAPNAIVALIADQIAEAAKRAGVDAEAGRMSLINPRHKDAPTIEKSESIYAHYSIRLPTRKEAPCDPSPPRNFTSLRCSATSQARSPPTGRRQTPHARQRPTPPLQPPRMPCPPPPAAATSRRACRRSKLGSTPSSRARQASPRRLRAPVPTLARGPSSAPPALSWAS